MSGRPITASQKTKFLDRLRASGNISESARFAGFARSVAYEERERDEVFAATWDSTIEESTDALEREARRRGLEGWEEPVFYQGDECGTIRRYSDTLLIFLLNGHRPQKFRQRHSHQLDGSDGKPMTLEQLVQLAKATRGEAA